MTSEADIVSLY